MPRNTTGGSGHKGQKNSEGSKARNNRIIGDLLLDDIDHSEGVIVGIVTKRLGNGRMYVEYKDEDGHFQTMNAPLRGGLRGKGKKSVWIEIGSYVVVAETGLAGTTHEIVSVLSPTQVAKYKELVPDGIEIVKQESDFFERSEEIDIEKI